MTIHLTEVISAKGTQPENVELKGYLECSSDRCTMTDTRSAVGVEIGGGRFIPNLEHSTATELATFVLALVTIAASPPPYPIARSGVASSVRDVVKRLRDAPSNREWRQMQDLATTIQRNVSVWIGVPSAERQDALLAVRNVLLGLEPDIRRLAIPNLDPRRIAFLVVDCARSAAPQDFAEDVTETPERTKLNVHVLRTSLLRSLEHLQQVALREWVERNAESQEPPRSSEGISSPGLVADPPEGLEERLHTLDVAAGQLTAMLEMGLVSAGPEAPLPSNDRNKETVPEEVQDTELEWDKPSVPVSVPSTDSSIATVVGVVSEAVDAQSRTIETTVVETTIGASSQSNVELPAGQTGETVVAAPGDGDLETELKQALDDELSKRESDSSVASSEARSMDHLPPDLVPAPNRDATQSKGVLTVTGDPQTVPTAPSNDPKHPRRNDRTSVRTLLKGLISR